MHAIDPWILLILSAVVAAALAVFGIAATHRLEKLPTTRRQSFVELLVEYLNKFVVSIIGPEGEKFTPFVGTVFIYILAMNLLGLIPPLHSPTSNLGITLSLAIVVFVVYNYYGIRYKGVLAYLRHLAGEPLWLAWLMLPVHIVGELARPLALALRLYGNVFGKEVIISVLAGLTIVGIPYVLAIPTQFPVQVFAVLISFVQALVFAMLACIYLSLAIHDEEH